MLDLSLISEAITIAGGQVAVATACGVSQPGVHKWTRNGFPGSDYKGKTQYAKTIAELCAANGSPEYTKEVLLGMTPLVNESTTAIAAEK